MREIAVAVVDDDEADRYVARRRFNKAKMFRPIYEESSGEEFLRHFYDNEAPPELSDSRLLIMMDINMPGLDGFETIEELHRRRQAGKGPDSVAVMMFTSSDNPSDKARAQELDIVLDYVVKPLDDDDIQRIIELMEAS